MSVSKLEPFDRVDLTFKTVNGHPLQASVLIPKGLQSRPGTAYPIIVNWHGGGFVVGDRLYEGWLPRWLLDLCLETPSLLIAPDYRLLPEANGADILSDLGDFWQWLHTGFLELTKDWSVLPDISRLACTGQSAGGYLAVQSALLFPTMSQIKVLISMAGSLYTDIPHYRVPGPKIILGKRPPPPWKAENIVRIYIKNLPPQAVRTSGDAVEMWEFLTCVLQQAYLARWLGMKGAEELDIMKTLEKVERMPPIWVVQGEQDSVVPQLCSTGFVKKLKEILPNVPVLFSLQPGDHGFEAEKTAEDRWVQEGLQFVAKYWP